MQIRYEGREIEIKDGANGFDLVKEFDPERKKEVVALQGKECALEVDSTGGLGVPDTPPPSPPSGLNEDGSAPHGTGLKLVEQIARAHGGRFEIIQSGTCFCGRIVLPADPPKM